MTYEEIVGGLRESTRELNSEGRLVRAGLKQELETAAIMDRYAWLYSDDSLAVVEQAVAAAGDEREREARKRVRAAVLGGIIEARTAVQEDRLATHYATSQVELGEEGGLPFFTAQAAITHEPDSSRRERLGEGTLEVIDRAEDLHLEATRIALELIRSFGYDSYTQFWSDLKQVDYGRVQAEVERVVAETRERYRARVSPWMEAAGRTFGTCPHFHLGYFRGMPQHEEVFTRERFEGAMRSTFQDLGLDVFSLPTVHIDIEDRPAKNPRASVWVPEAGVEVHLLTRPTGSHHDYSSFMHETGHALHYGLTDPAIGWPLANLGRSMAYAELWSYLVERIGYNPAWLSRVLEISPEAAARIASDIAAVDLMMFVRYSRKLAYELALYSGDPLDAGRGRALYASTLSETSGFKYDPRGWQFDRDPGFYSADYLRAWLASSALDRSLRARFGEDWWRSDEAGRWLAGQWRKGSLPEAEETVAEAGGEPWSGSALAEYYALRA